MTIVEDRLAVLEELFLAHGNHKDWEQGACIMEAVGYIAGEPWTDHPACASPVLTELFIGLNDRWSDDDRQLLKPYIVRLVGTNTGEEDEQTRRLMMRDWLVHDYSPAVFRRFGQEDLAARFDGLPRVQDAATWDECRAVIREVRDEAGERRRAAAAVAAAAAAADADAVAVAVADAAAVAVAVADAAAVADADAVAAAAADADAVAAAVAVAVADAAAVADAVAAAAAAADADAVAAAVAAADADAAADAAAAAAAAADADAFKNAIAAAANAAKDAGGDYWNQRHAGYHAAYAVLRPYYDDVYAEFTALELRPSLFALIDRLLEVGKAA